MFSWLHWIPRTIVNLQYFFYYITLPFTYLGSIITSAAQYKYPWWIRYVLEGVLVLLVVGLMIFLNWYFDLEQYINASWFIARTWLGILGLLIYLGIRVFVFILAQLPEPVSIFPDIQKAFDAGLAALNQGGISIRETPLYLVLGMPGDEEFTFTEAPAVKKKIRVDKQDFPIHWYASEEAIWVTLPGISGLSKLVNETNKIFRIQDITVNISTGGLGGGGGIGSTNFSRGDTGLGLATGASYGNDPNATMAAVQEALASAVQRVQPQINLPRLTVQEREQVVLRLEYFVSLLKKARYPVCPVNATLVILPYSWLQVYDSGSLGETVHLDMMHLQRYLGVRSLAMMVFTGLERSADFTEYVNRLPKHLLDRRCGCSFPELTELDSQDPEKLHDWLGRYFERQVFELYQARLEDLGNRKLFRFLDGFRQCRPSFIRMLRNAFPAEVAEPFYFGGLYFAGLGKVGKRDRPFFDGVLNKLTRDHDNVIGWTEHSLKEDLRYERLSYLIMVFVAILTALNMALIVIILMPQTA